MVARWQQFVPARLAGRGRRHPHHPHGRETIRCG